MTDRADEADVIQEHRIAVSLANLNASQPAQISPDDAYCIECGIDIPLARFKALGGRVCRCVDCQNAFEKKKKHGGAS